MKILLLIFSVVSLHAQSVLAMNTVNGKTVISFIPLANLQGPAGPQGPQGPSGPAITGVPCKTSDGSTQLMMALNDGTCLPLVVVSSTGVVASIHVDSQGLTVYPSGNMVVNPTKNTLTASNLWKNFSLWLRQIP